MQETSEIDRVAIWAGIAFNVIKVVVKILISFH
jgi:hypothetical protein